ncbi:MAG TPA: DPP IV N-terminal domain-containing protein [Planctomycetota bacterium]|jgi:hypothetical protein|nr:DPP IV N-terminal domain-containing protein [Planctomycetota bacterium]
MEPSVRSLLVLLLLGTGPACQEPRQPPSDDPALRTAVQQLGAEDPAARNRAEDALRRAGRAAESLLLEAKSHADPEVRLRATRLLEAIERGRKRERLAHVADPPILFLTPAVASIAVHRLDPRGGESTELLKVGSALWELQWGDLSARLAVYHQFEGLRVLPANAKISEIVTTQPVRSRRGLAWSPTGNALLLVSDAIPGPAGGYNHDERTHLHLYSFGAKELVLLTPKDQVHYDPTWSPDGTKIAFIRNDSLSSKNVDLYQMTVSPPGAPTRLTTDGAAKAEPAWSPDGRWIAFTWTDAPGLGLLAIDDAKAAPTRFAPKGHDPVWSPDSTRLAFIRGSSGEGGNELRIVDRDGRNERVLAGGAGDKDRPSWSPDGKRLLFEGEKGGVSQIFVVNADGSGLRQLTTLKEGAAEPVWAPQE